MHIHKKVVVLLTLPSLRET